MEVREFTFFRGIVGARVVSIGDVLNSLLINAEPTDNEYYELGYDNARRGLPINHYPLYLTEDQRTLYQRGWDNYVNSH
jgi:hypothetical protein